MAEPRRPDRKRRRPTNADATRAIAALPCVSLRAWQCSGRRRVQLDACDRASHADAQPCDFACLADGVAGANDNAGMSGNDVAALLTSLKSLLATSSIDCQFSWNSAWPSATYHARITLLSGILCHDPDPNLETMFPHVRRLMSLVVDRPDGSVAIGDEGGPDDISAFLDSIHPPHVNECPDPPGLYCTLLPFQRRAVSWAVSREAGGNEHDLSELHPVFEERLFDSVDGEGAQRLYYNPTTGRLTDHRFPAAPDDIPGGMICQTMGLGKTVEQVALILANPANDEWLSASGGLPRVRATLVVCPAAVVGQWLQEIMRHAPTLRTLTLFANDPDLDLALLVDADIVLTTYEVVRLQRRYQESNRTERASRSDRNVTLPTPLLDVCWWRVVLDEAQRIASESATTDSAMRLESRHRWVMTGTPICRRLRDLSGLLGFLGHRPLGSRFWFDRLVERDRAHGMERLRRVLSTVMYRHGKASVENELDIPPMSLRTVKLALSDVEHIKYSKLMRKCKTIMMAPKMGAETRCARLRHLLLRLRKICCYPFLYDDGRRAEATAASVALPIIEIKARMCREAETELDVALRLYVKAQNNLGTAVALSGTDDERAQVVAKAAIETAEGVLSKILADRSGAPTGEQIDYIRSLTGRAFILEALGRVADAHSLFSQAIDLSDKQLATLLASVVPDADIDPSINGIDTDDDVALERAFDSCATRYTRCMFCLMTGVQTDDAIAGLREADAALSSWVALLNDDVVESIKETPQVMACMRGRLEVELRIPLRRRALLRDLIGLRVSVLERLVDLRNLSIVTEDDTGDIAAILEDCRSTFGLLTMDRSREEIGGIEDDGEDAEENFRRAALGANRQAIRLDSVTSDCLVLHGTITSGLVRVLEKLSDGDSSDLVTKLTGNLAMIGVVIGQEPAPVDARCSSWLSVMFASLRLLLFIRQQITGGDENDTIALQCWERCYAIREELPNAYRREFNAQEKTFEDARAKRTPPRLATIDIQRAEAEVRRAAAEHETRRHEFRYISQRFDVGVPSATIEGDNANPDDDICPICRGETMVPVVTPCGHIFCSSCLSSYMERSRASQCPLRCRNRFTFSDCLVVEDTPESVPSQVPLPESVPALPTVRLKSDYGAKINSLLTHLINIRNQDRLAKSLVFSQWTDLLDVIRDALIEHDIVCGQLRGDAQRKARCVEQFVHDDAVTVFLIPMAAGASGLTMVAARYAFIMEPNLNPNIEDQAINRIHRIGQKAPTEVIRFISSSTVEEHISAIQERRRALGDQDQKGIAPEVFDEAVLADIFR